MPSGRQALGTHGEALAAGWYAERGYEIVARNWRTRHGEVDLIARRGGVLVFCEVKTRGDARFGEPAEAVTLSKQRRIRQAAVAYLRSPGASGRRPAELRFDVACVVGRSVEVIESAF